MHSYESLESQYTKLPTVSQDRSAALSVHLLPKVMSSFIRKVEQKLGDHGNVSSDPNVAPHKGEGIRQGDGPFCPFQPDPQSQRR